MYTSSDFVNDSVAVHGNVYDYSESVYLRANKPIKIICKEHGPFFQRKWNHVNRKQGCPICSGHSLLSTNNVIIRLKEIFGDLLDFTNVVFKTNRQKVNITCNKCKTNYDVLAGDLLCGKGCPICKESKGEREIRNFLLRSNLKFSRQFKFDDCVSINRLPFDFVVFNVDGSIKFLIEYQGHQHYKPVRFGGISIDLAQTNFERCVIRDKIKSDYCKNNNIKLIVIKYTEIKNISDILKDT